MKLQPALTDDERFPLLKERKLLENLRQDEFAPGFNFASGDRLDSALLQKVHDYCEQLKRADFWQPGSLPEWLNEYFKWCRQRVPFYRSLPQDFCRVPSLRRAEIAAEPWRFVADDCNLEQLLVYSTSGTTGKPMQVLFDPVSQAGWLPQLESILAEDGIAIDSGSQTVAICLVCNQQETLTYASLSTYLEGAGILKINLRDDQWADPEHRCRYLEKYKPQVITGDPFTFMTLSRLAPKIRPKAMVSSAMVLHSGLRRQLETQFACPVYDIYSLTECRMIAVSRGNGAYRLIRPDLFLEIMHPEHDEVLPMGERGEIVVSGGINPFLPLLRYRTGDFAALRLNGNVIELVDFIGRAPVIFVDAAGKFVNNVDIARAMCRFAFAGYSLHQAKDRKLRFNGWGDQALASEVKKVLVAHFGEGLLASIEIEADNFSEAKKVNFSSELEEKDVLR